MPILKGKKLPSLLLIALVLLGIGMVVVQSGNVDAAAATPAIGVVDYNYLLNHHPDTAKANQALQAAQEAARKEFTSKAGTLDDKGKQDLERQLELRVEQKRQELLKPILDRINAAIKSVADAKKLALVVYKNAVAYGGLDITTDVANKLNGK